MGQAQTYETSPSIGGFTHWLPWSRSLDLERRFRRATRGHPARLGSRNPTFCSKSVPLGLLQEWLRTAALAESTRDASSTRARLSLCTQGFRGVGQGGRSPRVSESSPPGRPDTPAGRPDGPKVSPGLSAGGCRVKSGSGPLERSLPPGSGALGRGRPVANCDPWVMIFRSTRLQTAQVISEGPRFAGSP